MRNIVRSNRYNRKGLKIGYWEHYYNNGNIYSKGSYKDGKKDGIWEYYHYDGQLKSKWNYINGETRVYI
jgi:antitoxin component YwqK of YwqJK toxin-antitoxin module